MDISSARNAGEAEINRDYIGMLEDRGCGCFAVCDGSPSSFAASNASEIVIDSVLSDFKKTSDVSRETIVNYFKNADEKLWSLTRESGGGLEYKTSAAVLLTDGSCVICGHLGNCRMYYIGEKYLQYITPDHTLAYRAHSDGKFRFPGIRKSPDRRKLTAYIGADPMCEAEIITPIAVKGGDGILLCTDGFWENITERQVERTLRHSKSSSEWLRKMLKIVRKNGPKDNYSAITIIF
ncbi:MAG TPA: protein phosphatase 2C domain-containing protein [Candidatus Monoglobus merdigallinarum]|uniref:Protein phosphatase 2C domain-containing protein n=1 Tax=Candidatus Monoglobus merdigallinarum TaxID=2838698 RepID=A0A9D1PQC2_9FIRM|nr:protein phosphatase 2C domain-containing protein [Candidatus Monoglobus merdigallinarum]